MALINMVSYYRKKHGSPYARRSITWGSTILVVIRIRNFSRLRSGETMLDRPLDLAFFPSSSHFLSRRLNLLLHCRSLRSYLRFACSVRLFSQISSFFRFIVSQRNSVWDFHLYVNGGIKSTIEQNTANMSENVHEMSIGF